MIERGMNMDNIKEKTNNQLYGRLGYISKSCAECEFDYCGGCPFVSEKEKIRHEIESRKTQN